MNRRHRICRLWKTAGVEMGMASLLIGSCGCILASEPAIRQPSVLDPPPWVILERKGESTKHASLAEALATAQGGDVLRLAPGTHRGPIRINQSGLVLRGEPGARLDANNATWNPQWTPAPQYGRYAFTTPIDFAPGTVTLDDRILIDARESRGGLVIHADGVGRGGRSTLQGVFTWIEKQGVLLISFARPLNPAEHRIEVSRRAVAAITVRNGDRCRIENLIITGGESGVRLENTRGSVVQRCLIYSVDAGVTFGGGANACLVQACDITMNPDALSIDCDPASGLAGDDTWNAHKKFGTYDKYGIIAVCSGADNEVDGCYIYNTWDGISVTDGIDKGEVKDHYEKYVFKGISQFNRGLKVHHTRIDLAVDDAMEPGGELVDANWYGNLVTRARCGVRFKTLTMGPFFFYNNVLLDCGNGLRLYKSTPASATLYVAHNVVQDKTGIIYHAMDTVCWDDPWLAGVLPRGTPGFRIYNNVFVADTSFANYDGDSNVKPNFKGDGNLYTATDGSVLKSAGIDEHGLFGAKPKFVAPEQGDWHLASESPGRGAGVSLAAESGVAWPEPLRSASRDKPDAGLLNLGDVSAPRGPVSGLWELAAQHLNLGERPVSEFSMDAQRWIAGNALEFPLAELTGKEDVVLRVVRAAVSKQSEGRFAILDSAGSVVSETVIPKTKEIMDVQLKIPAAAQCKALRLTVQSAGEPQWRVLALSGAVRIGMDLSKPQSLRKYDGGRYGLEYDIVAPIPESFRVVLQKRFEAPCQVEVIRPGSEVAEIPVQGLVETRGVAGRYQILLTFTKRADFQVEGPSPIAYLAPDQETAPLRPRWGKPAY